MTKSWDYFAGTAIQLGVYYFCVAFLVDPILYRIACFIFGLFYNVIETEEDLPLWFITPFFSAICLYKKSYIVLFALWVVTIFIELLIFYHYYKLIY